MNLAIGDVVEIGTVCDSIDDAIAEVSAEISQVAPAMNGWLVEVTAIGETKILGFVLVGTAKEDGNVAYSGYTWARDDGRESDFSKVSCLRVVGRKADQGCVWIEPNLANIYFRCQN